MDTVLFVNATIGFSENLFLVCILSDLAQIHQGFLNLPSVIIVAFLKTQL